MWQTLEALVDDVSEASLVEALCPRTRRAGCFACEGGGGRPKRQRLLEGAARHETPVGMALDLSPVAAGHVSVAVIIPYRDQPGKGRAAQLEEFAREICRLYRVAGRNADFRILVVEQSVDGQKFNRGRLLNAGFDLAHQSGSFNVFIFHDVDLIPSVELMPYYTSPAPAPVHIAGVWDRYSSSPTYFGGISAFDAPTFLRVNGFPNNYWGWGGEDDDLSERLKECGIATIRPPQGLGGKIRDLENMSLEEKLSYLRAHPEEKLAGDEKRALRASTKSVWQRDGLSSLTGLYAVAAAPVWRADDGERVIKITVNLTPPPPAGAAAGSSSR